MPTRTTRLRLFALGLAAACLWPVRAAGESPTDRAASEARLPEAIRKLMRSFDNEPSVRDVQNAALRHADLRRDDESGWAGRARLSNLFPEVDGEIAWLEQRDEDLRYSEDIEPREESDGMYRSQAENRLTEDSRLRRAYSIDASIDLGGLVFDRDELSASREKRQREVARRKLVEQVTDLYFERRKKQILQLADPPDGWRSRLDLLLEIERLTARLDGLTGGWFRRQLPNSNQGETR